MLSWIIQISIVSIIFIFLVHHLIGFFKSTLTVPKIKDLVNSPSQKYQYMFDTISKSGQSFSDYNDTNTNTNANANGNANTNSYTAIDLLPTESQSNLNSSNFILDIPTKDAMKDELKSFLKKQMNTSSNNNNNNNNDFLSNGMGTNIINSNML
jgi:hypothetical protein